MGGHLCVIVSERDKIVEYNNVYCWRKTVVIIITKETGISYITNLVDLKLKGQQLTMIGYVHLIIQPLFSCLNLIVNLFWGPLNIYDLPPSILYINLSLDLNSCTKKRKSLDLNFFDNVGGYSRRRPYPKKLKTWKKNCLALYHSFWADSKAILRTVIHRRIGIYRRGHKVCLENFSLWLLFLKYFHCF